MKKIFLLATAFAFTMTALAQPAPAKADDVIKMNVETHDFGKIKQSVPVIYVFEIKNISDKPVVVANASASCGCTVPDWTREPIPVGGSGFVKAEFDTKGKVGPNTKTITVTANTWPKQTTLKFKASVTAAAGASGPAN